VDVLYETEVTPDQIDHLGHMNVMFYGRHARFGAERLLSSLGLPGDEHQMLFQRDSIVRHLHEQLVGAPLAVRGGVLAATDGEIRLSLELVNTTSDDVAATFVSGFELVDRPTRRPVSLAGAVDAANRRLVAPTPERLPRTIVVDQDPTVGAPSLDALRQHDLAMRLPRVIDPERTDADGFVPADQLAELMWGGEATPGREFQPLAEVADGVPLGFATLESRATWARPVRAGDRLQSFAAEVDLRSKVMVSRHWAMDLDRGDLVAVLEVVSVAFDTSRRRAVEIPEAMRLRMASRLHPELAGPASTEPAPS
jgi:acyl-CoA thioester hydrolase